MASTSGLAETGLDGLSHWRVPAAVNHAGSGGAICGWSVHQMHFTERFSRIKILPWGPSGVYSARCSREPCTGYLAWAIIPKPVNLGAAGRREEVRRAVGGSPGPEHRGQVRKRRHSAASVGCRGEYRRQGTPGVIPGCLLIRELFISMLSRWWPTYSSRELPAITGTASSGSEAGAREKRVSPGRVL